MTHLKLKRYPLCIIAVLKTIVPLPWFNWECMGVRGREGREMGLMLAHDERERAHV